MNTNLTKEETEELNAAIQKYKRQHNIKKCGGSYVYLPSEKLVFHGKTQAEAYHKMLNRKSDIVIE